MSHPPGYWSGARLERLVAQRNEGVPDEDVAVEYGITPKRLRGILAVARRQGYRVRKLAFDRESRTWNQRNHDGSLPLCSYRVGPTTVIWAVCREDAEREAAAQGRALT